METIYSHSTITFNYDGRSYTVRFKKYVSWRNWTEHQSTKLRVAGSNPAEIANKIGDKIETIYIRQLEWCHER